MTRLRQTLDALRAKGTDGVAASRATENLDLRHLAALVRQDGAHLRLEAVTATRPWLHSDDVADADEVPTGSVLSELFHSSTPHAAWWRPTVRTVVFRSESVRVCAG
jgi:hypothetical protein